MTFEMRFRSLARIPILAKGLWEIGPWACISAIVLRIVTALIPVAALWVAKLLIDQVVAGTRTGHFDPIIWWLAGAECLLAVCSDVTTRVISHFDTVLSDRFLQWVGVRILEHSELLDLESFESAGLQDCLERARAQARSNFAVLLSLAQFFQQAISLLSLLGGLLVFSPILVLLQLACTLPTIAGETHYAARLYRLYKQRSPQRRELDYLLQLATSAASIKETKLFGLGPFFTRRYAAISTDFNRQNADLSRTRAMVSSLLTGAGTVSYYIAYVYLIRGVITGSMTIGSLMFLAGSFQRSKGQMQGVLAQMARVTDHAMYLNDIFDFFTSKPRMTSRANAVPAPRPVRHGLEFRNVSFCYANSNEPAVANVSFTLAPDETVALVGPNGAGKTTLIKLMSRLYDPTAGAILLDGVDLRDYDIDDWRRQVSILFQDYIRYDMPASENIGLGDVNELENDLRIRAATKEALAWPVISALPNSFKQMLGRRFEGGVDLSGGQWQKLALARACMRQAQLLILDEPAAALDPRSEHEMFQQFAALTTGRMGVLISHRFSTVRAADRILVFDSGKLVEEGRHEYLVAKGGEYASLFHLQAAAYVDGYLQ